MQLDDLEKVLWEYLLQIVELHTILHPLNPMAWPMTTTMTMIFMPMMRVIISQNCTGSQNPSVWKRSTSLSCIVNSKWIRPRINSHVIYPVLLEYSGIIMLSTRRFNPKSFWKNIKLSSHYHSVTVKCCMLMAFPGPQWPILPRKLTQV